VGSAELLFLENPQELPPLDHTQLARAAERPADRVRKPVLQEVEAILPTEAVVGKRQHGDRLSPYARPRCALGRRGGGRGGAPRRLARRGLARRRTRSWRTRSWRDRGRAGREPDEQAEAGRSNDPRQAAFRQATFLEREAHGAVSIRCCPFAKPEPSTGFA